MSSQTNSILRYVRPHSVWLCPDCDAENELTESSCFLCGCGKTVSAVVVHPVDNFDFKETDIPTEKVTTSKKKKEASSFYSSAGDSALSRTDSLGTGTISSGDLEALEYTVPPEKKRNPAMTIIAALLITLGLALLGVLIFLSFDYNVSSSNYHLEEQYYESTDISNNSFTELYTENK